MKNSGWDERDYRLWSKIRSLPSYGTVAGQPSVLLASADVMRVLIEEAESRRLNKKHYNPDDDPKNDSCAETDKPMSGR